jgi:hypothetical protein
MKGVMSAIVPKQTSVFVSHMSAFDPERTLMAPSGAPASADTMARD